MNKLAIFATALSLWASSPARAALTPADIGDGTAGSTQDLGNGAYTLTGYGVQVANNEGDQLHFAYETISGDFDRSVKIKSIGGVAEDGNRGGIMARETIEPTSKLIKIATSAPTADNIVVRGRVDDVSFYGVFGRAYAGVSTVLPNQWLRLRRTGNYFAAYVGTDGQNWSLITDRYFTELGSQLLVGVYAGAVSEDGTAAAIVEYESYGPTNLPADTTPPAVVSASTLDKQVVGIRFSESLDSSSVAPGDFGVTGATVTAATLGVGGDSVYLTVTGLTADAFTVTVTGSVTDHAGNAVATGSSVNGTAVAGWTAVDIGTFTDATQRPQEGDDPYVIGRSVAVSSSSQQGIELEIIAGGSNIWNPGDFVHYVYTEKTGDFDVQAEVVRLDRAAHTAGFGHAGIHVRERVYEADQEFTPEGTRVRNVMNTTYAEGNQERSAITIWRDEVGGGYGNGPVTGTEIEINGIIGRWGRLTAGDASGVPLAGTSPTASRWLRLARVGNEFISYYSYDGIEWAESADGSRHTLDLPPTVLVGFAEMTDTVGTNPGNYAVVHVRHLGDFNPVREVVLSIRLEGTKAIISWPGTGGTLQSATSPAGPYAPVTGVVDGANGKTYETDITGVAVYYRVR